MDTYRNASRLLAPLLTKKSMGLKALAFSGKGPAPNKAVYAIVCQTLEHKKLLDTVLKKVSADFKKPNVLAEIRDEATRYILMYELLLGPEQKIKGGGGVKRVIVKYEKELRAALAAETKANPIVRHVPTGHWPAYVRVNLLLSTLSSVHAEAVAKYGASNVAVHSTVDSLLVLHPSCASTLYEWPVIKAGEGVIQDLSSCLTAVALGGGNGGRWWDVEGSVKAGEKKKKKKKKRTDDVEDASGNENSSPTLFLDACAAPGNKTTHLAAIGERRGGDSFLVLLGLLVLLVLLPLLTSPPFRSSFYFLALTLPFLSLSRLPSPHLFFFFFLFFILIFLSFLSFLPPLSPSLLCFSVNSGSNPCRVMALDRDSKRVKILNKRTALLAPNGEVDPQHMDFLKTDPADETLRSLKAILLDPSCSGSGIVSQPDRMGNDDTADENARLVQLSNFQLLALLHAMSFPQVDYVAYSTCSINDVENEAVVSKALAEANGKLEGGERWRLVRPVSLESWKRRGKAVEGLTEEQADCLCRCDPFDGDETNGFFVSYFQREKVERCGKEGSVGGGAASAGEKEGEFEGMRVYREGMWKGEKKERKEIDLQQHAAPAKKQQAAPAAAATDGDGAPKTKTQMRKDKRAAQEAGSWNGKRKAADDEDQKNRSEKKRKKKEAFKDKQTKQKKERLEKKKKKTAEGSK